MRPFSSSRCLTVAVGCLALLAAACADLGAEVAKDAGDSAPGDGGSADSVASDVVVGGPCAPVSGDPQLLRLRGTVFTGDTLLSDGEVFVSAKTGKILCVANDCSHVADADKATVVCTNGIITPGLINPHDHATYNHLPRWKHTKRFQNRYQWQADKSYAAFKKGQFTANNKARCEVMKWSELRALLGGTTAMQGTSGNACIDGWIRDLDDTDSSGHGIPGYTIDTQVTKISGAKDADVKTWTANLKTGKMTGLVLHLGEGIDTASKDEWYDLVKLGLVQPGVSLIHAAGLTGVELAEAHQKSIHLIWSPQSNLDLYGDTTRVPAALNLGMTVALGPDWTPSGSMNLLEEMKCARQLSDKRWGGILTDERLLKMVTIDSAKAVGAGDWLGKLATGYLADIVVLSGDRSNPFRAAVDARVEQVQLVLVAGKPQTGDAAVMKAIGAPEHCEALDVCGVAKIVCMKDPNVDKGGQSIPDLVTALESALAAAKAVDKPALEFAYSYELFPLFTCGAAADALINCDVGGGPAVVPSATDLDGDGKANSADNCQKVFNPDQGNLDNDGDGDACDVCPLVANTAVCPKPGADDLDGDGQPNATDNCPGAANSDQADADKDGKGDACDVCPKGANPGDAPCPALATTVTALNKDGAAFLEGELVTLNGLVVTAIVPQKGTALPAVWAQIMPGVPHGGIQLNLPKGTVPNCKPGDAVTVVGKVANLFGLRALVETKVTVVGQGRPVEPLVLPVATMAESASSVPYRSLLVEVQNTKVTQENADADSGKDYGEFMIEGGLRVDDAILTWGAEAPHPKAGDVFKSIRGILTLSYGDEKLLPRSGQDLVK